MIYEIKDFINISKNNLISKNLNTMNFIKGIGAILIVFAIFASSCNKHLDDVKLTKEREYQTVEGLTRLVMDMNDLSAAITSTQTTIATLPETLSIKSLKTGLTDISSRIDSISSTLTTLSREGTATKALIEGLKNELLTLIAKVTADNEALKSRMNVIGTSDDIYSTQLNALVKTNTSLIAQIQASQKSADNLVNFTGYTQLKLVIDILKVQLAAAQISYGILLAIYMH